MTTTLTTISNKILSFLGKTSSFPGFYDSTKVTSAVNTAMNYVAVNMFIAGQGWLTGYTYADTTAPVDTVAIPTGVALIREARYLVGEIYIPLIYDDQSDAVSYVNSGVQQASAGRYRLLGNNFIFDPPLADGGTAYLQIESVSYPTALASGGDALDQQFDAALQEYIVFKAASVLAGSLEKDVRTWGQEETEWYEIMKTIVARRTMRSVAIRDFDCD